MEQMLDMVANLGFPMAVAGYLLVRVESKLDRLALSIGDLARAVGAIKGDMQPWIK